MEVILLCTWLVSVVICCAGKFYHLLSKYFDGFHSCVNSFEELNFAPWKLIILKYLIKDCLRMHSIPFIL